jgi:phosphoadenosine phosphosulfate reductase
MTLDVRIAEASRQLRDAVAAHAPAAFASSFGVEDMVILDLIHGLGLEVEVFTLDTGRLHEETHALIAQAREHYGRPIRVLFPEAAQVEAFVAEHGDNAFYRSIALRKACCEIRKLVPLRRALQGKRLWIAGLRREQSVTRADVQVLARDETFGLMKLNPLADWSEAEVWEYARRFGVPTNPLHQRGFPSIGCAPCTRAVQPGEDPRAGRWWWEQPDTRECGLHMDPQGRLVRASPSPPPSPARGEGVTLKSELRQEC